MGQFLFLNLGAGEIVLIAVVALLLFGAKKIPDVMKGLGKGIRSFREGVNDIKREIGDDGGETGDKDGD